MTERINNNIDRESQTPRPATLDVVKVNGRWAQVLSGHNSIVFLDEKTGKKYSVSHEINWDDYEFEQLEEHCVRDLMASSKISATEYEAIHWGPEQEKFPELKKSVKVFGEYKRKK